jgi:hypothetical protein
LDRRSCSKGRRPVGEKKAGAFGPGLDCYLFFAAFLTFFTAFFTAFLTFFLAAICYHLLLLIRRFARSSRASTTHRKRRAGAPQNPGSHELQNEKRSFYYFFFADFLAAFLAAGFFAAFFLAAIMHYLLFAIFSTRKVPSLKPFGVCRRASSMRSP